MRDDMAIARQLVTRDYCEVVRTDGQVWSISRDQTAGMSKGNVTATLRQGAKWLDDRAVRFGK